MDIWTAARGRERGRIREMEGKRERGRMREREGG